MSSKPWYADWTSAEAHKTNPYPELTTLARRFPTLADHAPIQPFDTGKLDAWAAERSPDGYLKQGTGAILAAQFVLHCHSCERKWKCGQFNLSLAMTGGWDTPHKRAFLSYVLDQIYEGYVTEHDVQQLLLQKSIERILDHVDEKK